MAYILIFVTPLPHRHLTFVGASNLLRLLCAVAMAAAMVTSVPCESHPPPGRRGGLQGRVARRPIPPY